MTSVLPENNLGKSPLNIRIKIANTIPIEVEVTTATATENLAALGRPAPSSLETRTLQGKLIL